MNAQMSPTQTVNQLADRAAGSADHAIEATKRATHNALDSLQQGVHTLHDRGTSAFTRAAQQVEDSTRRSLERARAAGLEVRDQMGRAGDRTVGYIQERPVPAVLIAAACGMALAVLAGWMSRSNANRP